MFREDLLLEKNLTTHCSLLINRQGKIFPRPHAGSIAREKVPSVRSLGVVIWCEEVVPQVDLVLEEASSINPSFERH